MKERQDTLQIAQEYSKAHRRKTLWYRAVTCLAAVVVFCTTYALILPAITLEKKCEIPEHTHTDACYTQVTTREKRNLICAVKADVVVHRHDSACYDENGKNVAGLKKFFIDELQKCHFLEIPFFAVFSIFSAKNK